MTSAVGEDLFAEGSVTVAGLREEFGIPRSTAYELMDAGRLPYTQIGRKRYIARLACGPASGNLVVLDFEGRESDPFGRWLVRLTADDLARLDLCPLVRTPSGGRHVYVRLPEPVKGTVYARDATGKQVLIESRGSQHGVV